MYFYFGKFVYHNYSFDVVKHCYFCTRLLLKFKTTRQNYVCLGSKFTMDRLILKTQGTNVYMGKMVCSTVESH